MEALRMDPGEYNGSYKLIGGRLSLDLVNTISWPNTDRQHDWLTEPDNITEWVEAMGLVSISITEADLRVVHDIRQSLSDVLAPLAHGEHPSHIACERFNEHLTGALGQRLVDPDSLRWTWQPTTDVSAVFAPVIVDAANLVAEGDHSRLKHCPSCDWLFEDQTRNRQRRWCDMADCGSRAKSLSYYHRTNTREEV